MPRLKAPFPYFGGKARVATEVWHRFGRVNNYVEPFFGSGAVLLSRPEVQGVETVNDLDGLLANFWRSIQADPDAVAKWADWPVNENDLHARHAWLVGRKDSLQRQLEGDPDWFDPKAAGWWVWGLCAWIGSGWCSGDGPWRVVDGVMVKTEKEDGNAGQGINRQLPHLGNAGQGINRQLPHLGDAGRGICNIDTSAADMFSRLSNRLRHVRVCCGDWQRVCGETPTTHQPGITGVFLDPPYSTEADRNMSLYRCESGSVAHAVREWAKEYGDHPKMRIALCGYDGEHVMPRGWVVHEWKAIGGHGNQSNKRGKANAGRERVWFSPGCLNNHRHPLFSMLE